MSVEYSCTALIVTMIINVWLDAIFLKEVQLIPESKKYESDLTLIENALQKIAQFS